MGAIGQLARLHHRPLGAAAFALWGAPARHAAQRIIPFHGWSGAIFYFFFNLGFFGLLLLSALDSSFLTLPFANDILVIVLSSVHRGRFLWYALGATVGSVIGSYVMYWVGQKGGEAFIKAHLSSRRYEQLHAHVTRHAPEILALPAIIPPPFPYTAWVLAAGALEVPRNRFMLAIGGMRFVRFIVEAVLATVFGRGIVAWLDTPSFRYVIYFLIFIAVVASAFSIYQLVRATRRRPARRARDDDHSRQPAS